MFRTLADAYAVLDDPARRARYDHTIRPSPRPPRPVTPPVFTRRGVLELSTHEATIVATMPLALATDGMTIVLPAGLAEGDRIRIALPEGQAVLAVSVSDERLDTT